MRIRSATASVATTLFALWALLAPPVLCLGGVIEHGCRDSTADGSCAHEEGCPDDPCGRVVLARVSTDDSPLPGPPVIHLAVAIVAVSPDRVEHATPVSAPIPTSSPFVASPVPLRI